MFDFLNAPNRDLFFAANDPNYPRLGEIVPETHYEIAEVVILGCPQDEGVRRNNGRAGADLAPDKIRRQFYKMSDFGIKAKIHDAGDLIIQSSLEETHRRYTEIVSQVLRDGKKIISLGGGNDLSYPDGCAMSENFGNNWVGINVDAHFDVQISEVCHSGTAYRQLLEEKMIFPDHFYEIGYQRHLNSPAYFRYLTELGVNLISLDQLRSSDHVDTRLRDLLRTKFIKQSSSLNVFFGFNLESVRAADAPGTSDPSPVGLRSGEFLTLVELAASLTNTKIIEFTEVNPHYDIDDRTALLVALAMHRFCSGLNQT